MLGNLLDFWHPENSLNFGVSQGSALENKKIRDFLCPRITEKLEVFGVSKSKAFEHIFNS